MGGIGSGISESMVQRTEKMGASVEQRVLIHYKAVKNWLVGKLNALENRYCMWPIEDKENNACV